MKLLQIGFGNAVVAARVKQIVRVKSAINKSWRQEADQRCRLIDATAGRHTKAMLITDSGHIILSSVSRQALMEKLNEIMPADKGRKKPARRSERVRSRRIASG